MNDEIADMIQKHTEELTESDEYQQRFDELVEEKFDYSEEKSDEIVEQLTTEFIRENDELNVTFPEGEQLLENTFKKITYENLIGEISNKRN
jgi:hypothetical protein